MRKIKILHLLPTMEVGGAATNLLNLIDYLKGDYYEHKIVYTWGGKLEKEFAKKNILLERISPFRINLKNPINIFVSIKLAYLIKKSEIDLIHSYLDITNVYSIIPSKILKVPIIFHFHGNAIMSYRRNSYVRNRLLWRILVKLLYKYANYYIAITKDQENYLKKLGIESEKIKYIPNGYSRRELDSAKIEYLKKEISSNGEIKFICISKLSALKNQTLLLYAFKEILNYYDHVKLIIGGDGPLKNKLITLANKLGIEKYVIMLGERLDVLELLSICDCFILPSLWELQPICILEAMSVGLPIIATNVGEIKQMVEDKVTGYIVKPNCISEMVEAMKKIIEDREKAKEMGLKAKKIIEERYSQERVALEIKKIYNVAIKDKKEIL